jgi:hypothetical protein
MLLVKDPEYREKNLAKNNIFLRGYSEEYPGHVFSLVNRICGDRHCPRLTAAQQRQQREHKAQHELREESTEAEVEDSFKSGILPAFDSRDVLRRIGRSPMDKNVIPNTGSDHIVSRPIPDVLYGYNIKAFSDQQAKSHILRDEMSASCQLGITYPFLVTEIESFKNLPWITGGDLHMAVDQCLGGSASCVNIAEYLNSQLRECHDNVPPINSAVFSLAINSTLAEPYVSWKQNESYYMQLVDTFHYQDPDQYIWFRNTVGNIIDWGKNERLTEIRNSIDSLLEDHKRRISEAAKSRSPPLNDDPGSDKRRKAPRSSSIDFGDM